ncbi:MAG: enoyl-CoA hydratase/isomerase family protein [Dehalococcoidia bacterium]
MISFETIVFEKDEGIAQITLNRPGVLNAYNMQMRDDLYEALTAIAEDREVRALIIAGAGERAFCAGADLTEFGTAPSRVIARQVRWERDVWGALLSLRIPTIAAIHGYALGSGLEIVLCCDLRIAAEDAQLGLPEASLGFIPAAGGTQTLPRVIGRSAALGMLLTAQRVDAREAFQIRLVHEVVPRERLIHRCNEIAQGFISLDPLALARAKEAVVGGEDLSLEEGLRLERRLVGQLMTALAG